ncbi:MAG: cytochrome c [Cyclobacteriaceae bacterium]|nr:cytochrome c [Cyclobacteriaceae bacterium]
MLILKSSVSKLLFVAFILMIGCRAKDDFPGLEYAPNMYHSVPYEGLSQITDESSGKWLSNREDGKGEYFNSNPNNPHGMNLREPVDGTVKRNMSGYMPYRVHKDSVDLAARILKNPVEKSDEILSDGKQLYSVFCQACHGSQGKGDGKVGEVMLGVPAYNVGRVKDVPEGHIFHVITHGKGRMWPHGSQITIEERWKIVHYVQQLQQLD